MDALSQGNCNKLARQNGDNIWRYFLATPDDGNDINIAIQICSTCSVKAQCFIINFDSDVGVAAGFTPYERKLLKWKKVHKIGESNWRSIDEFADFFRREKE